MAELTEPTATPTSSCCSPETQASCCEPAEKDGCCGSGASSGGCGCAAGQAADDASPGIRETVREKYAAAARQAAGAESWSYAKFDLAGTGEQRFGATLYGEEGADAPAAAVNASLGCGVPTAVADLHEGETVLDLGSGAGADVLISARRVGPTGKAIGLDMTDEMLELARRNAAQAGVENVEFVKGYIEEIPLADGSVDVIVSNCVLNLSGDKTKVLREAARVLRPGGRFAVSDVIASPDMDDATRADMAQWTGCIAGALTEEEFREGLTAAGLVDVEIRKTHQVHEYASSAIIRARKPADLTSPNSHSTEAADTMPILNVTHVTPETTTAAEHRVELFEPAMCCSSGVCGPSVDQKLIDVREDLRWARHQSGVTVSRHNLSSDPDAFVANAKVTGLIAAFGEQALPALLVDGEIVLHGRYPTRAELEGFLGAKPEPVELPVSSNGGCGCGSGGCR
jgi:arsenite methyltransferase